MFGAILKPTNSSFQKGITFCRSIYVKKVMKLLAFIFEQPSYFRPKGVLCFFLIRRLGPSIYCVIPSSPIKNFAFNSSPQIPPKYKKSKKESKDQESIQSSTITDPGYKWESDNFTIRYHKREPRDQPFPSR